MAGYTRCHPPQDVDVQVDVDLSSLFSRTSIQNSPHWPSIRMPSRDPSILTLNESDVGNYPDQDHDDFSSLANVSYEDSFSDSGSVLTANISRSSSSSRPSTPSIGSHGQHQPLSLGNRADKSLLIGNLNKDLPRQSVISDVVPVPPHRSTPNGDAGDRDKDSSGDCQLVSINATER